MCLYEAARHRTAKSGLFFQCREKTVPSISTKTRPLLNGLLDANKYSESGNI